MSDLHVSLPDGTHRFSYCDIPCWSQVLELRFTAWEKEGLLIPALRTKAAWQSYYDLSATHWLYVHNERLVGAASHSLCFDFNLSPDLDNYLKAEIKPLEEPFVWIKSLVVDSCCQKKMGKGNPGYIFPRTFVAAIVEQYSHPILIACSESSKPVAEHLGFTTLGNAFPNPLMCRTTQ